MRIQPKNAIEIEKMRRAGHVAAATLDYVTPLVKSGVSTLELNDKMETFMRAQGGIPATIGYRGYPKASCISRNEVVCHGIPSAEEILQEGDILNIDVTAIVEGYHGDTSRMYGVGNVSPAARTLMDTTYAAMMAGIATLKSGSLLSEIGTAIEAVAAPHGYGIVREYCGHGLGRKFHEDPQVLHYANSEFGNTRLRKGTTLTVEPMINLGTWRTHVEADGWRVVTADNKLSAQYEHSVVVTEDGYELLTASPAGYTKWPYL
jgi:methionyl aminopeptidase